MAAEKRLGRVLPPSLREFLLVSNGWRSAGNFVHRLAGAEDLVWLRDDDPTGWIRAYTLVDDELEDEDGEWAAYWLASWSGMGPERHESFFHLMDDLHARFLTLHAPPP